MRITATLAFVVLAACGGGPSAPPSVPAASTAAPTHAEWVARFDLPGPAPTTNCATGDSGQQGFSCGRLVESLVTMYRATGNSVYLDRAVVNIDASLARAATCTFAQYPAGSLCWTSSRYSTDGKPYPYLVHDGWWWLATLGFVQAVPNHPKSAGYLAVFRDKWRTRWDADYRALSGGRGAFVMSKWQTHYGGIGAGQSLAYNMSATWALALFRYSAITGDAAARAKAVAIATTFKTALLPKGQGVVWRYAGVLVPTDSPMRYMPITDSSHANTDVLFAVELGRAGAVFTAFDLTRMAYTFRIYVAKPGPAMAHYIDGSGVLDCTELNGFAALAYSDSAVGGTIAGLLNRPSNPYGSSRLGVSQLAFYSKEQ